MNVIQIKNSYSTWSVSSMRLSIVQESFRKYNTAHVEDLLNRPFWTLYIEWWLHNIGYYVTKPFIKVDWFAAINARCKDVDLQEWTR